MENDRHIHTYTHTHIYIYVCVYAIIMSLISARFALLPNWDDIWFNSRVFYNADKYGFWSGMLKFFLNKDTPTELRTYGLSKVLQYMICYFTGGSARVYMFLIPFLQISSSIFVYRLLRKIETSQTLCITLTGVWMFSTTVQRIRIFHYFSYLFIPFVFWLVYANIEINSIKKAKEDSGWSLPKSQMIFEVVLIALMVFTGESLLAFESLFFIICYFVCKKNNYKKLQNRYLIHLLLQITFVLLAVLIYKFFALKLDRFHTYDFNFFESVQIFVSSLKQAFCQYFWIPSNVPNYKGFWHILRIDQIPIGGLIIGIFLLLPFVALLYISASFENISKSSSKISLKNACLYLVFLFSLFVVYLFMCFAYKWTLHYHYFETIFPLSLLLILLILAQIMSKRFIVFLCSIIIIINATYSVVWYGEMVRKQYRRDVSSLEKLDNAIKRDIKSVVVFNMFPCSGNPAFWPVIRSPFLYDADSPFAEGLPFIQLIYSRYPGVEVYYISPGHQTIVKNKDGTASIISCNNQDEIAIIDAKTALFVGRTDLNYYAPEYGKEFVDFFNGMDEFEQSCSYFGIRVYSLRKGYIDYINELLYKNPVIQIDAGNVTGSVGGFLTDKSYNGQVDPQTNISYGYLNGARIYAPSVDARLSNIHGDNFSYAFSNLSTNKKYSLFFDVYDIWKNGPDQRVFDVTIETNDKLIKLNNVDPYCLIPNNSTTLEDKFTRIVLQLPKTEVVHITFKKGIDMPEGDSSLPFINVIGLYEEDVVVEK